jgi:hypothetical protein
MAFYGCLLPGPELATKGVIEIPARMLTLVYRIVLRWNTREAFWMGSVYDPTGRPIVRDIACRCDEDLLENVIRRFAPKGAIVVRDRTGADRDPGRDGWSRGIVILYEFEILEAAA